PLSLPLIARRIQRTLPVLFPAHGCFYFSIDNHPLYLQFYLVFRALPHTFFRLYLVGIVPSFSNHNVINAIASATSSSSAPLGVQISSILPPLYFSTASATISFSFRLPSAH